MTYFEIHKEIPTEIKSAGSGKLYTMKFSASTLAGSLIFLLSLLFHSTISIAQIYEPDGLRMPGEWNEWNNSTGMGGDFDFQKNSTGTIRWQTSFHYTGITGNQSFKFASTSFGDPWGNQWAGNESFLINTLSNVTYGTPSNPDNKITLAQNKWYSVDFEDLGYANTRAIFMETSAEPVNLISVEQHPLLVTSSDNVSVKIHLSASPSPEEKFYLRYSLDNWASSSISDILISGTEGNASIQAQPNDTTVSYYVFSTVISNPQQDYDMLTLRLNNNNKLNYSYVVGQAISCGQAIDVVITDPAFPMYNGSVTVYFNAALGNGGLFDYVGDVYAHTGVITNLSTTNSDWKYVKAEWGENTPETKLDSIGENLYSMQINNIRQYYGVPASETILKMAFVFRGGEPNPQGSYPEHKNADGTDILVDVYNQALNVKIISPTRREPLASPNKILPLCVEALQNQTISIYLNDSLLTTETTSSLTYPLEMQGMAAGTYWIKAVAVGSPGQARDSVSIYLRGAVVVQELPSGMKNGINYIDNSTVTLVLNDPAGLKNFAFAIGEYSNWMPSDATYMKRTPDGKSYWVTFTALQPQKEYSYQYYIDGQLKLADAYADKVLDPWNDRWIPTVNYPGLKQYPFDKTTGPVSIFQTGQTTYPWTVVDFVPTAANETQQDLMIYELLLRDFTDSENLAGALEKLDYLKNMGVNAIELMPVSEFDGNESWGYAPNFFFATDKFYGRKTDYKKFIDECHKRGMAVIMDIVTNHAYGQCPLVQMYFDPSSGAHGQPTSSNPWLNPQAPHPLSIGYDFNHESPYTREFFKQVLGYWLTEYKVDGFRFDLSKGLTQKYSGDDLGAWSAYDQSRINILTDYYNYIKSVKSNAYVILEHFADNSEETILANTGMLLWSAMHNNYKQVGMGWQENSDISRAYHANRGWTYPNLIDYMENHDEERLMLENLSNGNAAGNYNLKDTLSALHHMQMASVLFLGIPGPKMVWQFGELGYDYSILFNGGRTASKPPRWDYWNQPARQELYRVYAAMANLRKSNAFRFGNYTSDLGGLGKRMWISHSSMNVVISANMGVNSFDMAPGFSNAGQWFDYFSGQPVNVTDPVNQTFNFGPGEFKVFTNVQLPRPYYYLNFTVNDSVTSLPLKGATITVDGAGYQLSDSDGKAMFTSTPDTLLLKVTRPGYRTYRYTLTVNSDLEKTILLKPGSEAGVEILNSESNLQIYPNPARSMINISAGQKYFISCTSMDGRLIWQHKMNSLIETIDISSLENGIYLFSFKNKDRTFYKKIVVE
jgi:glycosidase